MDIKLLSYITTTVLSRRRDNEVRSYRSRMGTEMVAPLATVSSFSTEQMAPTGYTSPSWSSTTTVTGGIWCSTTVQYLCNCPVPSLSCGSDLQLLATGQMTQMNCRSSEGANNLLPWSSTGLYTAQPRKELHPFSSEFWLCSPKWCDVTSVNNSKWTLI